MSNTDHPLIWIKQSELAGGRSWKQENTQGGLNATENQSHSGVTEKPSQNTPKNKTEQNKTKQNKDEVRSLL